MFRLLHRSFRASYTQGICLVSWVLITGIVFRLCRSGIRRSRLLFLLMAVFICRLYYVTLLCRNLLTELWCFRAR